MTCIDNLNDKFRFGKFCGCTLAEVAEYNPDYIKWIVENVSGRICVIEDSAMEELRMMFPHLSFDISFEDTRYQRLEEFDAMVGDEINNYDSSCYGGNCDCNDSPTYGRYAGSYAQDEMGYSDDDIDTIFDGDPLAYWNID